MNVDLEYAAPAFAAVQPGAVGGRCIHASNSFFQVSDSSERTRWIIYGHLLQCAFPLTTSCTAVRPLPQTPARAVKVYSAGGCTVANYTVPYIFEHPRNL